MELQVVRTTLNTHPHTQRHDKCCVLSSHTWPLFQELRLAPPRLHLRPRCLLSRVDLSQGCRVRAPRSPVSGPGLAVGSLSFAVGAICRGSGGRSV
eukprot:1094173-Amphidinium_carterae.1